MPRSSRPTTADRPITRWRELPRSVAPAGGIDELATHVETLLRDDALRQRLAAAGREHVRRFSWDLGAELLEAHLCAYVADPDRFRTPPLDD